MDLKLIIGAGVIGATIAAAVSGNKKMMSHLMLQVRLKLERQAQMILSPQCNLS